MIKKKRLGVNIDHVATIRNARGENYPDPLKAALLAEKSGANSITIHLREDRRHIRDYDLKNIKEKIKIPINLEMAPTREMLKIALKYKPHYVCIVPEKRSEITTESGLNLNKKKILLKNIIKELKKKNIRISLFVEPKVSNIRISKQLGADCVELHTGNYCNSFNNKKKRNLIFSKLEESAILARKIGLNVHAGHGLTYETAKYITRIKQISEFNIGHFIISESVLLGLKEPIKKFIKIVNQ